MTTYLSDDWPTDSATNHEWTDRAAAWRRWAVPWATQTRAATTLIVALGRVAAGAHVLDLASGPGEPALTLAHIVGPRGHVVATDIAPAMIAAAQERGVAHGLMNISFAVADAQRLPFASSSFDVVTCRFGIAHVPDYRQALAEIQRVLKQGGRAAFVVWGPRDQNPYFTLVDEVLTPYPAPAPTPPRGPGPFTFAEAGSLSRALIAAGFKDVEEGARYVTLSWPGSVDDAWRGRHEMSASATALLASLTPAERDRIAAAITTRLRAYEHDGRVDLPALVIGAAGIA